MSPEERVVLLDEMHRALLAEFGAHAIYRRLGRRVRDAELRRVLEVFCEEERAQQGLLRGLMVELGARPPEGSLRRRLIACALALALPVVGPRPLLRLCEEAEGTAARWYGHFRDLLAERGRADLARTCDGLATTKLRHAGTLETWVRNLPVR